MVSGVWLLPIMQSNNTNFRREASVGVEIDVMVQIKGKGSDWPVLRWSLGLFSLRGRAL